MANSPITALVKQEESSPQVVGTSQINFSFVSPLSSQSYLSWRQWDCWFLLLMALGMSITLFIEGISPQGEGFGIALPETVRALLRSHLSWWPAESQHCARSSLHLLPHVRFTLPGSAAWHGIQRPMSSLPSYPDNLKGKNACFGSNTLPHTSFLESTNLSVSASDILGTLFEQDFTCFIFFLATLAFDDLACRHRRGDLAMHKGTVMVTLV